MAGTPWIIISILILLILFGVLFLLLIKRKKRPADYYTIFVMGMIWLPIGIPLKNYALSAMGMIFMIIGLLNKDKWKENHRTLKDMDKDERKLMTIVIAILLVFLILGVVFLFLANKGTF